MSPEEDKKLISLLIERDNVLTTVVLRNKEILNIWNIAWGYDMGDDFAHVTTNISPSKEGCSIDFFSSEDVVRVVDPISNKVLFSFV